MSFVNGIPLFCMSCSKSRFVAVFSSPSDSSALAKEAADNTAPGADCTGFNTASPSLESGCTCKSVVSPGRNGVSNAAWSLTPCTWMTASCPSSETDNTVPRTTCPVLSSSDLGSPERTSPIMLRSSGPIFISSPLTSFTIWKTRL
ncbi:hypothetical protein D3C74_268990 [compost metagenome]